MISLSAREAAKITSEYYKDVSVELLIDLELLLEADKIFHAIRLKANEGGNYNSYKGKILEANIHLLKMLGFNVKEYLEGGEIIFNISWAHIQ